ncbi:uncharacterized protein EV154DRAFT_234807 [Mucor mucedo]|uniref:uncharacterized protein n=1 Tax=Mucor mucedo TaxID=29922 RepID=UPI00221EA2A4|nr:uncharacterized protein EV154DRAFT_234807 [Mucor mucedo]KAI7890892.1 hypothetical protein EV154DRAFT_234807 [Mucor mucedo]
MEVAYNFSQHLYCVSICFDEKKMYTKYFISGIKQGVNRGNYIEERASILYRVTTKKDNQLEGEIMFSGAEADERRMFYTGKDNHMYVDSVFLGLNKIHKKMEKERKENKSNYEYDVHDTAILQGARRLLEKIKTWSPLSNSTRLAEMSDYHFAMTLPTKWDKKIQTNLIRPLFVEVGLITNTDHPDKVLFFTQLQSDFRYLQSLDNYDRRNNDKKTANEKKIDKEATISHKINKKIISRKKYHVCSLTFTENRLSVNIDLFSAYHPQLTTAYSHYDAKFLSNVSFCVTFESKIKRCIELYIKIDGLDIKQVGLEDLNEVARFISEHRLEETLQSSEFTRILVTQETLEMEITKNNLGPKEIEDLSNLHANNIRSSFMRVKTDLYERIFHPIEESFWRNMKILYNYSTTFVYAAILILRDIHATKRDTGPYEMILKWLEDALNKRSDYKAIIFGNGSNAIHRVPITDMLAGTANQIKHYIEKSNAVRDPLEIIGNVTEKMGVFPLMPLFKDSIPSFIINIGNYLYLSMDSLTRLYDIALDIDFA